MKVYVQIVDTRSGISQSGMIEESIEKGFEIANALGHFGVDINTVNWLFKHSNAYMARYGEVENTTKVVSVIVI